MPANRPAAPPTRRTRSPAARAAIVGIAGTTLSDAERQLFAQHPPAGVILFARNVGTANQLRQLTASLRGALPEHAVLMVDQEGGRVARLRPPHWRAHPAAAQIGALPPLAAARAAWITGALIGQDCSSAGLDVVCAPVLDLRIPGAHDIIGDRAFSEDPAVVATLGSRFAAGLRAAGCQPVAKHIPGHGRAAADSHLELPRLQHVTDADLAPFRANAGIGWAMTAHILYAQWDATRPATLSQAVITNIIRRDCGFTGVLVSDDLAMKALTGAPASLARQAIAAGCDLVLHCTGEYGETAGLLADCPPLSHHAIDRLAAARAGAVAHPMDAPALAAERDQLMHG